MDFIERIFGVSPDRGSGALELLLFLIPVAGLCIIAANKILRRISAGSISPVPKQRSDSRDQ
jgi:hypothetical protein